MSESGELSSAKSKKLESAVVSRREFIEIIIVLLTSIVANRTSKPLVPKENQVPTEKYSDFLATSIVSMKEAYDDIDEKADPALWAKSIREGFKNSGLPPTSNLLSVVLTLIRASSGFRDVPPVYGQAPTPAETVFDSLKKQWTGGPMEVNFAYVMDKEGISEEEALQRLNTRDGGIKYGLLMLKDIIDMYPGVSGEDLYKCIFADWNAGIGRSVRAGLQTAVSDLTGVSMRASGLLLWEDPETGNMPLVEALTADHSPFGLSREKVLADLELPSDKLQYSEVWKSVTRINGSRIKPVPADLDVPGITGRLKEVLLKEGTSAKYSEHRFNEFQEICKILRQNQIDKSRDKPR